MRKLISQAYSLFTGYVFHIELKIAKSPSKGHYRNSLEYSILSSVPTSSEICPKFSDAEG